jgi:hypothetical protein
MPIIGIRNLPVPVKNPTIRIRIPQDNQEGYWESDEIYAK